MPDPDGGNRRRLPTWMLPVNAQNEPRKSANEDGKSQATESVITSVTENHNKAQTDEVESKQKGESLGGSGPRRRAKKAARRDESPKTSVAAGYEAKKRQKRKMVEDGTTIDEDPAARKRHMKSKTAKNSKVDDISSEKSYEEIELTVDDLLIFAQEFVVAEKEKLRKQPASKECTSETTSSLSVSSKSIAGGDSGAGGFSQILSKCTSSSHNSLLTDNKAKERYNHSNENIAAASIITTGGVAQDMLNLYLGSFLQKLPREEQNNRVSEPARLPLAQTVDSKETSSVHTIESTQWPSVQNIESKKVSSIQSATDSKGLTASRTTELETFASLQRTEPKGLPSLCELNKQLGNCALTKEEVPVMKKKSSLKDKVAMYFD